MRKAVLDRFEGPMAVFILEDTGEVISCLHQEIGSELSEGDHVLLKLSTTTEKGLDNFAVVCLEISNRIDVFALSRYGSFQGKVVSRHSS